MASVELTRRGRAVAALLAIVGVIAVRYGTQSLNAVLVPGVVAFAAAYWQVSGADAPSVERALPEDDVAGTETEVTVSFQGDEETLGVATDAVDREGLAARGNQGQAVHGDDAFRYDLDYERRGVYAVGPTRFAIRDLLGLLQRPVEYPNAEAVVVYPPVRPLPRSVQGALSAFEGSVDPDQRQEFDSLREYERGDALRDVHWKTSARQPSDDLVVKEFAGAGDRVEGDILLGVQVERGDAADDAAVAAASIAAHLLSEGLAVGVVTPEHRHEPGVGIEQRGAVLDALARLGTGTLPGTARHEADVLVRGDRAGVSVVVGDRAHPFHVEATTGRAEVNP